MFRRAHRLAAITLALALPMAACDTGTDTRAGTVSILLTDAPGPEVVEAWVTITDIYLQGGGGEADPPGGRVYLLSEGDETHELLSLANTVAELVTGAEVPAGTYGQLRVVISDGCIVTAAGDVYASSATFDLCGERTGSLQMPSMAQSGAKVLLNGFQVTGGDQAILLDFDVSQSFGHAAGASGMWVMTPVIHGATIQDAAAIATTLAAGDVTLPEGFTLGQFSATLTPAEGDTSRVDFQEADGVFRANFRYLIAGNGPFQVRLNAPAGLNVTVAPASPQSVSPATGETVELDWVLQTAEAAGD